MTAWYAIVTVLGTTLLAPASGVNTTADPAPLRVAGEEVELTIMALSDHTVRILVEPIEDRPGIVPASDGRVLVDGAWGDVLFQARELDGVQTLSGGTQAGLRVTVRPSPLTVEIATAQGELVQQLVFDEEDGSVAFRVGDGPVHGLGSGGQFFDRRGSHHHMRSGHIAGEYLVYGARIAVPFLVGTDGWSIFLHRPYYAEVDLRDGETGRLIPTQQAGFFPQRGEIAAWAGAAARKADPLPIDLFVTHVDEPSRAHSEQTRYLGQPAMPPRWAMGYMQSHRNLSEGGAEELMRVARTFREKGLPVDALIYLGSGFTAGGWNTWHGEWTFQPNVFPRPQEMLDSLNAMDYNVVLHLTEPPDDLHGTIPPGDEAVGSGHVADYWAEHEEVFEMGIAGWWPDMGDPLDGDARLSRHYLYHAGPLDTRPGVRPWSLHRTGFAGMARFGGWTWTGDVNSAWETLAAQVPVGINASLSTSPFWGTDIFGFYPTRDSSAELYVRWFQFATFTPSFRAHGVAWRNRLPWGWNPGEPGPVELLGYLETGSLAPDTLDLIYRDTELHDDRVEPIIRRYLELRYRLMPYTYTLAREAHDSGLPLMRALWFHFPDDDRALERTHEYLWGPDILVAPVVEPGVFAPIHDYAMREIYLPEGAWYDFWRPGNPAIPGGQTIRTTPDLATLPLYVRAGAILPLDPVRQHTGEPVDEPTTLRIHPGADGAFDLYDDDGRTLDFEDGAYSWTRFRWDDGARTLSIQAGEGEPVAREFVVVLVGEGEERTVAYEGEPVQVTFEVGGPE